MHLIKLTGGCAFGLYLLNFLTYTYTTLKISLEELRTLPQPRLCISFKENLEGLDAVKPVVGDLAVSAGATGMRLCGRVQTLLKLNCDRCLKAYFQSLTVDIDERFVIQEFEEQFQKQGHAERELSRKDFVEPLGEDGVLDISDVVYQAVTLATPTACLCGDQCPGPPQAHADAESGSLEEGKGGGRHRDQIDPRWKNLKSLFPNEETETKS